MPHYHHREHTVSDNDAEALFLRSLELALEVFHVGISVAIALSLAQAHTIDDGSVVERVGDNGIFCSEQGFEHTAVGIETSGIKDGIVSFEEARKRQLLVLCACLACHR